MKRLILLALSSLAVSVVFGINSANAETSWSKLTSAGSDYWISVATSSDGNAVIAGTKTNYVSISTDGGASWTRQTSLGQSVWSTAVDSTGTRFYAASIGDFYIKNANDATWTKTFSIPNGQFLSLVIGGSNLYLASVTTVYKSVNEGLSWTPLSISGIRQITNVSCTQNGSVVAVADIQGYLHISIDGGNTWHAIVDTPENPLKGWGSIAFSQDGTRIIAIGSNGTYYSSDSGQTWSATPGGALSVAIARDGTTTLSASVYGGVSLSKNFGKTWVNQTDIPNSVAATSAAISEDGNIGYIATDVGFIYKGINISFAPPAAPELSSLGSTTTSVSASFDVNPQLTYSIQSSNGISNIQSGRITVSGLSPGKNVQITLTAQDAYGQTSPSRILTMVTSQMPKIQKSTIICTKKKITKKVSGISPKCPTGYKVTK